MILPICFTIIALAVIGALYSAIVNPKERKLALDKKRWELEREKSDYIDKSLREMGNQTDYVALKRLIDTQRELEARTGGARPMTQKEIDTPGWMDASQQMRQERM